AGLCGLSTDQKLDGVSLQPLLMETSSAIPERMIFSHWNGKVSVRTQHFRLDDHGQLFDMVNDPGQTHPINEQQAAVALELQTHVDQWKAELLTGIKDDQRPFPIGHPDFPLAQLPARDGQPHGQIERSNKAPNCSYFTNWKNTDDTMTWPVEVLEKGDFEVEMYYTCPESLVGAEVQLTLGKSQLRATIDTVNNPPLKGAEHDRVNRDTESLVKDFKPLQLGVVHLDKGEGELTLRASNLPSTSGTLEMRLFMFRRVR
ncbi:MAG: N-acetylgalactosamine 6-sulfate sulfatase, partial [Aureliella sp.]